MSSSRCTLYGAVGSPYSCKIRALLRYRRIPFVWHNYALGGLRVAGLTEAESRAFFQTKGWAPCFTSAEHIAKPLGRRARLPPRQRPGGDAPPPSTDDT